MPSTVTLAPIESTTPPDSRDRAPRLRTAGCVAASVASTGCSPDSAPMSTTSACHWVPGGSAISAASVFGLRAPAASVPMMCEQHLVMLSLLVG